MSSTNKYTDKLRRRTAPSQVQQTSKGQTSKRRTSKSHTNKGRAVKRQKTGGGHATDKADGGRVMNPFLNMPLDILYEILSHLMPVDLLQLARANKSLRALLMSPSSSFKTIWKTVRENASCPDPIPEPLEGLSEPKWAYLLFEDRNCVECGEWNIEAITLEFKRRLCEKCVKSGTIKYQYVKKRFPKFEAEVVDITPWVDAEEACRIRKGEPDQWYWIKDLRESNERVANFKAKESHSADFRSKLQDWLASETAKVSAFHERCAEIRGWMEDMSEWQKEVEEATQEQNILEIQRRLLALGHNPVHVRDPYLIALPMVIPKKPLDDDSWNKIAPQLFWRLRDRKHIQVFRDRTTHAAKLYRRYKKTILPIQTLYLPSETIVTKFPHIKALVDRDASVEITDEEWTRAVNALPSLLIDWMHAQRDEYSAMLPVGNYPPNKPMRLIRLKDTPSDLDLVRQELIPTFAGPLELATAVFEDYDFWEWGGKFKTRIGRGLCGMWSTERAESYGFFPAGSQTAASLVKLVGKDPMITTAADMDLIQEKFYCLDCAAGHSFGHTRVRIYPWRLAVEHTTDHNSSPKWDLSSTLSLGSVCDDCYELQCHYVEKGWSCNRCSSSTGSLLLESEVLEHVREHHDISNPVENQDYFYHTSLERAPRTGSTQTFNITVQGP
ncbi:hypothetical protein DENSPDRAFT_831982 [Dentipellis sp. KUC8613]|nr:hypothetical protein DENSPDRAFT_831982 [Dentipellis sp. KUC8613]